VLLLFSILAAWGEI
jgi:hypothetical protein